MSENKLTANTQERIASDARDAIRGIQDNKKKDAIYHGYIHGATTEALRNQRCPWIKESDFDIKKEIIYCSRSKSKGFGYIYHTLFIDIQDRRWVDGKVNTKAELEILDESITKQPGGEMNAIEFAEWKDKHAFWGKSAGKWIVFPDENDSETCVQVDSNEGIYKLWQQTKSK